MASKKIITLIVTGLVTIGLIGGTLAWFTSSDKVTNNFSVVNDNNDEDNQDVEIYEDFPQPGKSLPGSINKKIVQVKNEATYNQFIRVKITKEFDKKVIDGTQASLDSNMIILNLVNQSTTNEDGKWVYCNDDGYYYFIGKVKDGGFTDKILDSVKLSSEISDKVYQGATFKVNVQAESIQAANGAYADAWGDKKDDKGNIISKGASKEILDKLATLEKSDDLYNQAQISGTTPTS